MSTSIRAAAVPQNLFGSLRDLAWLDQKRVRAYLLGMALALCGAMARAICSLNGGYDHQGALFGSDYASFWAASRQILAGHAAEVYVPALHQAAELAVLHSKYEAFFYPPPYLLLCIPLALLPFFPSLLLFLSITGGLLLVTVWRIVRTPWALVAVIALPPVSLNIIPGQNAFLTAAILGSGVTLMDRRPRLAGAILGLMVIKPHLALAVPIALVVSRRWRVLAFAGASAAGLLALSWLILGSDVWAAFLSNSSEPRDTLEQGLVGFAKMQSAFALARWLGAAVATAYALQCAVGAVGIGALFVARYRRVPPGIEQSLIMLACLLITPFLLFYDLVILIVPLACMLRHWMDQGFPPWSKLLVLLVPCLLAPFVFGGPQPLGLPVILALMLYLLWSVSARLPDSMRSAV